MVELPSSAQNAKWYPDLKNKFQQEVKELDNLPLNINHAPVFIKTEAEAGSFELAWDLKKQVLMVWATNKTWDYIYKKIVKEKDSNNKDYYVDASKQATFLEKIQLPGKNGYLGSYPSSLSKKIQEVVTWTNQILQDGHFGKWIELAYLLPSYIPMHFGPHLELAESQIQQQELALVQAYAEEVRKFFNQRGKLIGYGVGDSGLWIDGNRIYVPNRNFRLIWGLRGRSDFFLRKDSSVECWDLKTISPNKTVKVRDRELTKLDSLRQVNQQAPAKLVCPSKGPLGFEVLLVTTIGVLGVGCSSNGNIVSHHEIIPPLSTEEALIEYPKNFHPQQNGVLNRFVRSRRIEQVKQLIEDSPIKRFELSAKILEESVDCLVDALMSSNEWDSIKKALDEYHQRKYNRLPFSVN